MEKIKAVILGLIAVCFLCGASPSRVDPIINYHIASYTQDRREIIQAFLRRTTFIRGSLHPIRLVLFPKGSQEQVKLASYVGIPETLLELELQSTANRSAQPKRVTSDLEMLRTVGGYVGSLGYLVGTNKLVFNTGPKVVFLDIVE